MSEQISNGGLRIVVFTDRPPVAAASAELLGHLGHPLVGIVTSRKRNPGVSAIVDIAPPGVDVIVSERPRRWAAMVEQMRPDVIISSSFPWRIPEAVLAVPRYGAFNLHPSLLPTYRGTATPHWTILNGERTSGVTAHRMVDEFDAGHILAQATIEIDDDDDVMALIHKIFMCGPEVMIGALERLVAGDLGEAQDESQATYFGEMPESERVVDWNSPARRIHNQARAFAAFMNPPGAFATIAGTPARILRTRLLPADGSLDAEPGTVIARDDEGLTIQAGDGPIKVMSYEPA